MGLGAVPGRQPEFREGVALAVKYAKELKCPSLYKKQLTELSSALMQLYAFRIHLMAGRFPTGAKRDAGSTEMEATFIENLKYAADILKQENLIGLLEPINNQISDPNYFLTTPQQAAAILEKVGRPSLKLQLDIFHCQIMNGNLTQNLKTYFPIIGHIQIAQVPERHEPDSPGELNFHYLFQLLESMNYSGYIGCEYKPKGKFYFMQTGRTLLYEIDYCMEDLASPATSKSGGSETSFRCRPPSAVSHAERPRTGSSASRCRRGSFLKRRMSAVSRGKSSRWLVMI
ncbi:putative hydroxypyruvate isomerase, partial [Ophiophagus hannah]